MSIKEYYVITGVSLLYGNYLYLHDIENNPNWQTTPDEINVYTDREVLEEIYNRNKEKIENDSTLMGQIQPYSVGLTQRYVETWEKIIPLKPLMDKE